MKDNIVSPKGASVYSISPNSSAVCVHSETEDGTPFQKIIHYYVDDVLKWSNKNYVGKKIGKRRKK